MPEIDLGLEPLDFREIPIKVNHMQLSDNGFPRRNRIDLYTPAESAIAEAMAAVESLGCHTLLTEAVCLLARAKEAVADFVELPQT